MAVTPTKIHNVLALDVGGKRVGVAMTNTLARLPHPHATLVRDGTFWDRLKKLLSEESIAEVVIGLPRNLEGRETAQTAATRQFTAEFQERFTVPVHMQDEALTSHQAEQELNARGKPFTKGDIDALAATYILEDYLKGGLKV
ncbi:MAG TPA: Holliday junction resolvase RuvX [Candidatus Limnocylindria bacterium]|nr:Holliday junction resolvase RuvX [Candidatus Limnocylindria bacterium]